VIPEVLLLNAPFALHVAPNALALGLVIAAMVAAVWAYATRYEALARGQRAILLAARLLALTALLVAAFAPVISVPAGGKARNRLLLLVDHSGSMTVRDGPQGRTRLEAADSAASAAARSLGGRYDVRVTPFGGSETALGDAIRASLQRNDPDSVAAILVVSDGVVNRGEDPDRALAGVVPAYGLWVGAAEDPPSVGIAGVDVPAEAVAGRPAPIAVRLRQGNRPATDGTVRLVEDGVERARARFSLASPGASAALSLPYTPSKPGVHFLEVKVDGVEGDANWRSSRPAGIGISAPSRAGRPRTRPGWSRATRPRPRATSHLSREAAVSRSRKCSAAPRPSRCVTTGAR
jgi:hypothetical protein